MPKDIGERFQEPEYQESAERWCPLYVTGKLLP